MGKTLWIVSGGIETVPGIIRAREMGLHVVVSDINPDAPGFTYANDRVIASTYDSEATVKAAKAYHENERPLDGIICIASDVPLTVAKVAEELGLPGISVSTATLASDKLLMKKRFVDAGIAVPWFSNVESSEHLHSLVKEKGFPLVIKPVDSRGARGVLRLIPGTDLDWAYNHSYSHSPSGRVMVEKFISGPQISTESILIGDHGWTPGFTDRNYEFLDRFAPYIIENGGQQPTILNAAEKTAISRLAKQAGRALGIGRGIVKGDMVLSDRVPMVIEIATRLSGGWFSTDQIPLATGVDLVGAAIKLALGEEIKKDDLTPRYWKGVAIRYFFPDPGIVKRVRNIEKFEKSPWVHKLLLFAQIGDTVEPVTNHTKRAGFVITTGETRDEAVARANEVVENIKIETRLVTI